MPLLKEAFVGPKVSSSLLSPSSRLSFPHRLFVAPSNRPPPRTFLLQQSGRSPQIFVIFTHEAFHVITGVLCSGRLTTFVIDPNSGGHTGFDSFKRTLPRVVDPYIQAPAVDTIWWSRSYTATLLMGSFGSAVVGFLYVVSYHSEPRG